MRLIKKLFGGDPLAAMRKALQQCRWADALTIGEAVDPASLTSEAADELQRLLVAAGDGLAELNLAEGEGCLRSGDIALAVEHFALAAAQARSDRLQQRISAAQASSAMTVHPPVAPPVHSHGCGSSCSQGTATELFESDPAGDLDSKTRLELILASYPPEHASAYADCGEEFLEAFLLAHEGREREALERFERIDQVDRGELFYFERGALLGRLGEVDRACADLEEALARAPGHRLAIESIVAIEIFHGRESAARERLEAYLQGNREPAFCHGALATMFARNGDAAAALEHGRQALAAGNRDPETILLTASLLERAGRMDESEKLLQSLPGGGCSGGANIPLAEFWLRQERNLDKALEAFKGALRQDSGQPRWAIRIAQTYLAKGWTKDGIALLEKTVGDPRLDSELRRDAEQQLRSIRLQYSGTP